MVETNEDLTVAFQNINIEQCKEKKIVFLKESDKENFFIITRILHTVYDYCITLQNRFKFEKSNEINLRRNEMLTMNGIIICFPNSREKYSLFNLLFTSMKNERLFIENRVINLSIDNEYFQLSEYIKSQIFFLDFLFNLNIIIINYNFNFNKIINNKFLIKIKFFYNKYLYHLIKLRDSITKSSINFPNNLKLYIRLKTYYFEERQKEIQFEYSKLQNNIGLEDIELSENDDVIANINKLFDLNKLTHFGDEILILINAFNYFLTEDNFDK